MNSKWRTRTKGTPNQVGTKFPVRTLSLQHLKAKLPSMQLPKTPRKEVAIKRGQLETRYTPMLIFYRSGYTIIVPKERLFISVAAWLRKQRIILLDRKLLAEHPEFIAPIIDHEIAERKFFKMKVRGRKLSEKEEHEIFMLAHRYAHEKVPLAKRMKKLFA